MVCASDILKRYRAAFLSRFQGDKPGEKILYDKPYVAVQQSMTGPLLANPWPQVGGSCKSSVVEYHVFTTAVPFTCDKRKHRIRIFCSVFIKKDLDKEVGLGFQ